MQTDLPKITEKIAAWSPVFPDYDVTHVRHHAAVVTDSIWSTVHALKLSLLPGLLLIELPLILTSTLIYGCNRVWNWRKGGGSMGIATLFWTKETSNRLFLPPVVTGGAFSLGITWDWQSNGRFHETSFFWGGLWPDFSAPETSLLGDPVSPTQFTTMFTVYENEAVGTKPKAMSGRRRLAGDQVSAKPPSYRPLAGKGVSKPPPPNRRVFQSTFPPLHFWKSRRLNLTTRPNGIWRILKWWSKLEHLVKDSFLSHYTWIVESKRSTVIRRA